MSHFNLKKMKEEFEKEKEKNNFSVEKFLKENEEKLQKFEELKKKNKPTIFSDDRYGV